MSTFDLIATTTFGLESVISYELHQLGYNDTVVTDGRIAFKGDTSAIARTNIFLRTADRILIRISQFTARDFEELFQGIRKIDWPSFIPEDGKIHVVGKSVKSILHSVPHCQSVTKKAIIDAMKRKYNRQIFSETGPVYKIEMSLNNNIATISIDTTGEGLHKRGYREEAGDAPLRENLAAGLVLLSRWTKDMPLADIFCGSGTIAIEAALIGINKAPGIERSFVSETWPIIDKQAFTDARQEARGMISQPVKLNILASDIDPHILKTAKHNAINARVLDFINFSCIDAKDFNPNIKNGLLISNPPYGERLGDIESAENIYKDLGRLFNKLGSWAFYILSPNDNFLNKFGIKSDKNRKLYNGNIKCYLHQYSPLIRNKH